MDGVREYYAKQSKSVRKRQILYDFTHMWNLRNKINYHEKKREENQETDSTMENKLMVTRREVGGGMGK